MPPQSLRGFIARQLTPGSAATGAAGRRAALGRESVFAIVSSILIPRFNVARVHGSLPTPPLPPSKPGQDVYKRQLEKKEEPKKGKVLRQERYAGVMQRSFYVGENLSLIHICSCYSWHSAHQRYFH